ncbi:MAG TPA: ssl1498 family light-harvesting-like protein [Cyanothece sp. UBA12306]|nr:ssl1498 family light-harvesting-like protein [Cyanothece sp. UBA12306]
MYTTTQLDNGILKNYSVEPKTYYAQYPAPYEQRRYLIRGVIAALFISTLMLISALIS